MADVDVEEVIEIARRAGLSARETASFVGFAFMLWRKIPHDLHRHTVAKYVKLLSNAGYWPPARKPGRPKLSPA